ncbi:MAG: sodium-dependent bicarbonate transport family permease [Sulfurihydrogenibium sp.]
MSLDLLMQNILNPAVMMFFLGLFAAILKSPLDIPQPLPKLFSLYLLISIGFHGGYELAKSGITGDVLKVLLLAMLMAILVPIYAFFILRIKFDVYNAAAIAATYGSISAVTFITAGNFLNTLGVNYGGYMVAGMTLMESPAIVIGLILVSFFAVKSLNDDLNGNTSRLNLKEVLNESLLNPSVYILLGTLIIGFVTGEKGWKAVEPLFGNLFKGMLAFFLLDMGIVAGKRLVEIKKVGTFLIGFAILLPVFNALVAIGLAKIFGLSKGDALMFTVLCASASYIAVPAAMRMSIPEANPSLYVTPALAITFPFNISFGIPLYYTVINNIWG